MPLSLTTLPGMTCEELEASQFEELCRVRIIPDGAVAELQSKLENSVPGVSFAQDAISPAMDNVEAYRSNNGRPSDGDYQILRTAIHQLDNEVTDSDREVLSVQLKINEILSQLNRAENRRSRKEHQRDTLKAFASPVRLLPSEILTQIFSYLKGEEFAPPSVPILDAILRVCRSWKNVCVGSASLWDTLSIKIKSDPVPPVWRNNAEKIPARWTRHAGDLPLKLSLVSEVAAPPFHPVVSGIVSLSHRLSNLRIAAEDPEDLGPLLSLPSGNLPLLENLTLSCRTPASRIPENHESNAVLSIVSFIPTPRLRKASIDLKWIRLDRQDRFAFPWNQLTHLRIDQGLDPTLWYTIFCQCVNLQHGTFTFASNAGPFTPNLTAIIYNDLHALNIRFSEHAGPIRIDNLLLPVLQDLCVIDEQFYNKFTLRQIPTSSLRKLTLVRVHVGLDHFVQFLSTCVSLEELRIDLPVVEEQLFKALRNDAAGIGSNSGLILPNLISFAAFMCADAADNSPSPDSYVAPLVDLVRSWHEDNTRPKRLQDVTLFIYAEKDENEDPKDHPILVAVAETLASSLRDCIYHEVSCPTGFVMEVVTLFTEEFYSLIPFETMSDETI